MLWCRDNTAGSCHCDRSTPSARFPVVSNSVDIQEVGWLGDHRLRFVFRDGFEGEIDFAAEEWVGVFAPLADPDYFSQVAVEPRIGTIVWPNGADYAPDTLYRWVREGRDSVPT